MALAADLTRALVRTIRREPDASNDLRSLRRSSYRERWAGWLAIMLLGLPDGGRGSVPAATNYVAKLAPVPPLPALVAAAENKAVPLKGMDLPSVAQALAAGDRVTMLVTLHQPRRPLTQWLLHFEVTADAAGAPPPPRAPATIYTTLGGRFAFAWKPVVIRVRTVGPFVAPRPDRRAGPFKDTSALVTVNQVFLGLGLDQATAALDHIFHSRPRSDGPVTFEFGVSSERFSPLQLGRGRKMAAQWHITPAEERALAGGVPALFTYFDTVQHTPELASILLKVLSRPSVWSIVKHLGVSVDILPAHPKERVGPLLLRGWNLPPDAKLFSLPLEVAINQHRSLRLTLIVTAPRPPFLTCGGIVGFLAENPDRPDNYLTLRVISARDQARKPALFLQPKRAGKRSIE